jgi:hypothetical protein
VTVKKEILLMHKFSGHFVDGRIHLKLPDETVYLKPSDIGHDWVAFIQSTSHNRKLIANTRFLYETDPQI